MFCCTDEYTQEVKQRYAEIFPNLTILETGSVAGTTLDCYSQLILYSIIGHLDDINKNERVAVT
jgi:hypothetical protein